MLQSARRTNETAGDGTTTTVVLAYNMFKYSIGAIEAGYNPMGLKRGMEYALQLVLKHLRNRRILLKRSDST